MHSEYTRMRTLNNSWKINFLIFTSNNWNRIISVKRQILNLQEKKKQFMIKDKEQRKRYQNKLQVLVRRIESVRVQPENKPTMSLG